MQTDGRMAKYWLPWLVGEGDGVDGGDVEYSPWSWSIVKQKTYLTYENSVVLSEMYPTYNKLKQQKKAECKTVPTISSND